MQRRVLGRTGLKVSEIAIGGIGPMGKYGPVTADGTSPRDPGRHPLRPVEPGGLVHRLRDP